MEHKHLAVISKTAYQEATFTFNDVECFLTEIDNTQIIAVRGTEPGTPGFFDVLRDLTIYPVKCNLIGYAHAGFSTGAAGLLLNTDLISKINKNKPLRLVGHSMGGAISLCLTYYFMIKGYNVAEWVGFGAPRVLVGRRNWGNVSLANYCHGNDPVPQYLPLGLLYRHPVNLTKIGKKSRFFPTFKDHRLTNYIDVL